MVEWANLFSQAQSAISEARKLADHLEELDQEEREKEKTTAKVLKQIESQGATKKNIKELIKDEKEVLGEESELLKELDQANQDERKAEKVFDEIIDALDGKENDLDAEISEIRGDLKKITSEDLTKKIGVKTLEDISKSVEDLLEESNVELEAVNEFSVLEQEEFFTIKVEQDNEGEMDFLENLTREAGQALERIGDQQDEQLEEQAFQTEEQDEEMLENEEQFTQENIGHLNEQMNALHQEIQHTKEEFQALQEEIQEFESVLNQQNSQVSQRITSELEEIEEKMDQARQNIQKALSDLNQVESDASQKAEAI